MELYADGARGVYIPQFFAESVKRECVENVSDEDWAILAAGPDHELYWDVWTSVLDNAVLTGPSDGRKLTLWQDGDLWLVGEDETIPEA